MKKRVEHFNSVLNPPSSINEDAIDRCNPQIECNVLSDELPTVMKTRKSVQQLSSGKAPGAGAISPEFDKAGGGGATHGKETDIVLSLYVEEGCYPTII